jgi:4-hydroxyphenylpyruvate dioxygenase
MSQLFKRFAGFEYFVRDLERTGRFYRERLGFTQTGRSAADFERGSHQRTLAFRVGDTEVACTTPVGSGSPAARYLARHPDGIGSLVFEVTDIDDTFARLERNGATPISEVECFDDDRGRISSFSITTPFGDTSFRFIQRSGSASILPGIVSFDAPRRDELGFTDVDHVTANLLTMKPALLWLEHVLELQSFWGVQFHTADVADGEGSGLRSQVLWDPESGFKLACNEPLRPAFERSQISRFCADNRGDGVQHVALGVRDLLSSVRTLRERGVELMPAPAGYYERLPEHLSQLGLERIDEDPRALAELGILVDGSGPGAYLLQIFLEDAAKVFDSADAGPFFFELIQRKGDTGFGAGNFRALFTSIEREQLARAG